MIVPFRQLPLKHISFSVTLVWVILKCRRIWTKWNCWEVADIHGVKLQMLYKLVELLCGEEQKRQILKLKNTLIFVMMNLTVLSQKSKRNPSCRQQLINGHLRARGIQVQRMKLCESVKRTDPIRRHIPWHKVLSRRTYSVTRSNSLCHIDGHHSLIRWRIVYQNVFDFKIKIELILC